MECFYDFNSHIQVIRDDQAWSFRNAQIYFQMEGLRTRVNFNHQQRCLVSVLAAKSCATAALQHHSKSLRLGHFTRTDLYTVDIIHALAD